MREVSNTRISSISGGFDARIGKASNSNENNGQYGAEMLKFFNNNEMRRRTIEGKKPGPK